MNTPIENHPMIGTTLVFGADRPPYDPTADTEPGVLICGNQMEVLVKAVFTNWNGVADLDMFYVLVPETGFHTHFSPREAGVSLL